MYCVSIGINDFDKAYKIIQNYEMAEIRLDLCMFNYKQIKKLFSSHDNLIVTYRGSGKKQGVYRKSIIKTAILAGARWVDLDLQYNDREFIKSIRELTSKYNTALIISVHNYKETPNIYTIQEYIDLARNLKADLVKLVFQSNSIADNNKVLSLYKNNKNILAFTMGKIGKVTRAKALKLGAPFTYISLDGEATAPGQMTLEQIKKYI